MKECPKENYSMLTQFSPIFYFYTPWKGQKTFLEEFFPVYLLQVSHQVLDFKESRQFFQGFFFNVLKTVFTHFKPISTFYSPLKYQKASKFLMFSKNIDRVYIPELGYGFYKCFFLFLLGLKTSG